jgi:hypothetical protein
MRSGALLVALVVGASAFAADDPKARATFAAAERAFAQDDYPLALEQFRAAMALAPHDAVRFNIAVCLERLGRFRAALREYELAAQSVQLDGVARAKARDNASRVKARLGTLDVTDLDGEVYLDDELLCRAPCQALVDPGTVTVELRRGEARAKATVAIERQAVRAVTVAVPVKAAAPAAAAKVGVGPLTWIGAGVLAVGAGLFAGFGLRAQSLHQQYLLGPTVALRNEGMLARDVANGSLGGVGLGAVVVVLDLAWLAQRPSQP